MVQLVARAETVAKNGNVEAMGVVRIRAIFVSLT
jgi:hypothetical protein